MMRFTEDQKTAVLVLSLAGAAREYRLSLDECAERMERRYGLRKVSGRRLREALERMDAFAVDRNEREAWEECFLDSLAGELRSQVKLSPRMREKCRRYVDRVARMLEERAGATARNLSEEVTAVYFEGVNTLTMDDDYLSLRKGGRVVELVALEGNDANELKDFLRQGGDLVLSLENAMAYRDAVRVARMMQAYDLADRKPDPSQRHRGLVPGSDGR